jgi:outer membrane protein assembly factor BamD (BamD/ComL family)
VTIHCRFLLALLLLSALSTGCQHSGAVSGWLEEKRTSLNAAFDRINPFTPPPPPAAPVDSLVLRGDRLEQETPAPESMGDYTLAGAYELYRRGEYGHAEKVFRLIADNKKNPVPVAEEARFYEAEALRRQGHYPKAADTYAKMLTDFPSGQYREQALQHMYEIANYWLDETRAEIEMYKEVKDGKRWFVMPAWLQVRWEPSKPFFDIEGRAIEKLEQVRYNDMTGPLADRALFLMGSVKFYREDYKEAEHYFTQVVEMHPNSPLAEQAIELAIIAKHMSTGGSDYDGRKVAEARQLVDVALRNYPNLATKKQDFLERQLFGITMQQAEKDYKMAEFYRRTNKPKSAWFYYEIVRRRYPGTKFFDMATERMHEIRAEAEQQGEEPPPLSLAGRRDTQPEARPAPRSLPVGFGINR